MQLVCSVFNLYIFTEQRMTQSVLAENVESWKYKGEGNASLVITHCKVSIHTPHKNEVHI